MKNHLKVSVVAISYNQQDYIAEMLESIVIQDTDFDFEIIIADDASTDKTQQIITDYAEKYPSKIHAILREKNVGVQHNLVDAMKQARGDYIALCEGDDYWTDPKKIQTQADFLDANIDYSLTFHPVRVFYENGEEKDEVYPEEKTGFSVEKLLQKNFIQTNSVMYRKQNYSDLPLDVMPLDWYLHLYHAQFGKIGFTNRVMAAYRRHQGGVWWNARHDIEELWIKYGLMQVSMFARLRDIYGKDTTCAYFIDGSINYLLGKFIETDEKRNTNLFRQVMDKYPELANAYATELLHSVQDLFGEREALKNELERKTIHTNKIINKTKKGLKRVHRILKRKRGNLEVK